MAVTSISFGSPRVPRMGRACLQTQRNQGSYPHPHFILPVPLSTARLQSWGMLGGADAGALPAEVRILTRSRWFHRHLVNRSLMNKKVGHV